MRRIGPERAFPSDDNVAMSTARSFCQPFARCTTIPDNISIPEARASAANASGTSLRASIKAVTFTPDDAKSMAA